MPFATIFLSEKGSLLWSYVTRMNCFILRNSSVAYTVALGLFLAVGRETTGKIPPGKVRTSLSK